jgi:hypothetical protein
VAAAAAADTRHVAFQSPSPELHAPLKTHLKKFRSKNMKRNIYIKAYSFVMISQSIILFISVILLHYFYTLKSSE